MYSADISPRLGNQLLASLRTIKNGTSKLASPTHTPKSDRWEKSKLHYESDDSLSYVLIAKISSQWNRNDKEQKVHDALLDVPKLKPLKKKKVNHELYDPNSFSGHSNWDHIFESETDFSVYNVSRVGTGDSFDWEENDSRTSTPGPTQKVKNVVFPSPKKDQVFISNVSKRGMKCCNKHISTTMKEVEKWLNEGVSPKTKNWLPVITDIAGGNKQSGDKFEKKTIGEALSGLNPLKQGLACFVGPVDGKLCYKICVCDLNKIKASCYKQLNDDKNNTSIYQELSIP